MMLIDCGHCSVRGDACADCVVTALFDAPSGLDRLTAEERRAIEVFDRAGFDVEVVAAPPAPRPVRLPAVRSRHVA
jgi:hypothetical protein